ncbi:hypothetical protein XELAEV_18005985mg [Xenopus laevis]|uniref:Helix-turn-helix domain-containing protein n=1 Tax=Xenopus laevis TaxID=8355 RepID=A0A974DYF5_XENLA|nr:hypothetical protein XELAEV_18005985mg [Xenopus laevis]
MDVHSLYTCIPHEAGIQATRELMSDNIAYKGSPIEFVLSLLEFILYKNYFKFKNQFFLQLYETKHILGHPLFRQYGGYYRCYIDDLFFLWYGSKEDLVNLVDDLNQIPSNIRFTVHNDPEQIQFLDVTVYKDKGNNKLQTKIYQKATDRNSLLHYTSSHPKHLLESLPKSQMMRVVRLTSEEQERNLNHMATQFLKRGYPKRLVDNTKQWAMSLDRTATIKGDTHKKVPKNRNDTMMFTTTYDACTPLIKNSMCYSIGQL